MITNFLDSLKETIGQMDSKFGYSSESLTRYFDKSFPPKLADRMSVHLGQISQEQVLSKISETLLFVDSYKQLIKMKYHGFFNQSELAFIFQYFNGKILNYRNIDVFDVHTQFIEDFNLFAHESFPNEDERETFIKKITSMYPFEFFVLGYMIIEDWEKIPVSNRRRNLFDELTDSYANDEK